MDTPRLTSSMIARLLAAAFAAVLLASCGPPGGLPICYESEIQPPEALSPGGSPSMEGEVVDTLTPTLSWTYPGTTCRPDSYVLTMATSWSGLATAPEIGIIVGTEYRPGDPLLPGTTYIWTLASVARDGRSGSRNGIFRTGPLCDEATSRSLEIPLLLSPANREHIDTLNPTLEWDDPTPCHPVGAYAVEIDTSPAFPAPLIGRYDLPYLYVDHPWVDFDLEPCTTYYWRVHAVLHDYPDVPTPYSDTWSFTTGTEAGTICPLTIPVITPIIPVPGVEIPPTGHAAIAGHVWHDECAVPWESTDVAPPGCVIMPDGGMEANGILDPGESGIEGVTVLLDDGACPGTDGWSYTTDASGYYTFHDLTAGTYCIEIDAASDGNEDVLIPGNWTVPYRWYGPGPISVEVILGSDDDISRLNDFAWDYQFLPAPSAVTPSAMPLARVLQNANCRFGPGIFYPLVASLSQGQSFPIQGRNADGSWWWIDRADGDCWLADSVVETEGDTSQVPPQQAPPTPTITPVLGCWQRPVQGPLRCVVPCPETEQNPSWCTP